METRQQLSDEQEQMRLEGLRVIARIIARHALAHPGLYGDSCDARGAGTPPLDGQVDAGGPPDRTGDAA